MIYRNKEDLLIEDGSLNIQTLESCIREHQEESDKLKSLGSYYNKNYRKEDALIYNQETGEPISNNKITATVKLNDTNSSCKLFSAGEMRIKLPDNLSNIKISEIKMLYANGLKLENAKLKDGYIIIDVKFNSISGQGLTGNRTGFNTLVTYK